MTSLSPTPTPTAKPNPYAANVVVPVVHTSTAGAAMPATVSNVTGGSVIAAGQARNAQHNAIVLGQSGRKVVGGSKRSKRTVSKRKRTVSKRSKRTVSKRKRTVSKRSKRGGDATPTPTPTPTPKPSVMTVPQFAGAHNAGANTNSIVTNNVATNAAAQATLDDPNAQPAATYKVV
jgi:hypothetical protein